MLNPILSTFPVQNINNIKRKVQNPAKISFPTINKAHLSLHQFSRHSQLLNITWRSSTYNFIQIGQTNVENYNRITFTPLAEEWISMHQFFIKCKTAKQHYMEIFSEFNTNHSLKYRNYMYKFIYARKQSVTVTQPNHNYVTTIHKEILHHIS
jgi:hypothetical protein